MMQNTAILYHPESIAEMQLIIICLITRFCLYSEIPDHYTQHVDSINTSVEAIKIIFTCLTARHGFSFFVELFRRYEIERYGKVDVYGVPGARFEGMLGGLQYFFICFLIGFICKQMLVIERKKLPWRLNMCVLWIIVDLISSFSTRLYLTLMYYLKIKYEIK